MKKKQSEPFVAQFRLGQQVWVADPSLGSLPGRVIKVPDRLDDSYEIEGPRPAGDSRVTLWTLDEPAWHLISHQAPAKPEGLAQFVTKVERAHFRTHHDTGAEEGALMIWNMVRAQAGMPPLTQEDLIQRYLDDSVDQSGRCLREGNPARAIEYMTLAEHLAAELDTATALRERIEASR